MKFDRLTFKNVAFSLTLFVFYFVAGKFGLKLAFVHASATAVWPPTGIALAAFLLFGYRIWPVIFLSAFFVNITTEGTILTSLGIALGNTMEGVVGAYLVQRFAGGLKAFNRYFDIFKFAFFAGIVATTVSATIGVTSLILTGFASLQNFNSIWLTWWLGDMAGALVVGPSLILLVSNPRITSTRRALEGIILLLSMAAVAYVIFSGIFPAPYVAIIVLLWAAFRFSQRAVAFSILLLSAIAIWGTLQSRGPFIATTPNESLLALQAFMGIMSVTSLAVSAVVAERRRVEVKLRARTQESEELTKKEKKLSQELKLQADELKLRVEELEKLNKVMVGRELKMIELKKEIEKLKP